MHYVHTSLSFVAIFIMTPLKIIFFMQLFQFVIWIQWLLILGHVHTKFAFEPLNFVSELQFFSLNDDTNIDWLMFEKMANALIFHSYKISCIVDLLLNKYLGDWDKTRLTTWFFQHLSWCSITIKSGLNIFRLVCLSWASNIETHNGKEGYNVYMHYSNIYQGSLFIVQVGTCAFNYL